MIEHGDGSVVTVEQTAKYFPNLASLHPDTKIQAYREFKPMKDKVEITVFWREPGKEKFRLDAEIEGEFLTQGGEVTPADIRLVSLVGATRAVT